MDRIRRSLRDSFRKRSSSESPSERHAGGGNGYGGDSSKPQLWSHDEASVRSGTCTFSVKYLGSLEVGESRGMQVCEEALKILRANRRRPTKGVLYVSGDGLRVVDSENKGLVVDQTIEKVSFCAPDRNFEKGFAYICRDGTTRRWMCHGFHAVKDSGERLSHAVGCAFAVCLERKQKRDREAQHASSAQQSQASSTSTTPSHANTSLASSVTSKSTAQFQRQGSFKQAPLTERLQDPQNVKPAEIPPVRPAVNPHAVARPHGNRHLFERQGSLRMPQIPLKETSNMGPAVSGNNQDMFRRFNSLRLNQLPSNLARYEQSANTFGSGAILEEDPLHSLDSTSAKFTGVTNFAQSNSSYFSPPISELGSPHAQTRSASFDAPLTNGQGLGNTASSAAVTTNNSCGSRLRGDEWLQTATKHAKIFQSYRQSPPIAEQTIQEAIPTKSPHTIPPSVAPPSLPPRQPQLPPVPSAASSGKPHLQHLHAQSFDSGRTPAKFPVDFRKTPTEPTILEFDAKWNELTHAAQQRRHSDATVALDNGKANLSATNPFSQESSSINI